ncbi:hypothetical protein BsWGS_05844 [Bradybaena similaris]
MAASREEDDAYMELDVSQIEMLLNIQDHSFMENRSIRGRTRSGHPAEIPFVEEDTLSKNHQHVSLSPHLQDAGLSIHMASQPWPHSSRMWLQNPPLVAAPLVSHLTTHQPYRNPSWGILPPKSPVTMPPHSPVMWIPQFPIIWPPVNTHLNSPASSEVDTATKNEVDIPASGQVDTPTKELETATNHIESPITAQAAEDPKNNTSLNESGKMGAEPVSTGVAEKISGNQNAEKAIKKIYSKIDVCKQENLNLKKTVSGLQSKVDKLSGEVQLIKGEVQRIKGQVQGIKAEVKGIKAEVKGIKAEVKGIKEQMEKHQQEMEKHQQEMEKHQQEMEKHQQEMLLELKSLRSNNDLNFKFTLAMFAMFFFIFFF